MHAKDVLSLKIIIGKEVIFIENKTKTMQDNSVLNEIKYLRGMNDFLIDSRNSNRYRVMVKEQIGYTAYCFSTPIYNLNTGKMIIPKFEKTSNGYYFKGTNGTISVCQNRCVFETREGRIIIFLQEKPEIKDKYNQRCSNINITPTFNGIRFVVKQNNLDLLLKSEIRQESIYFNANCFSVMSEMFKPFLSVAPLYASDGKDCFSPVAIGYQDKGNQSYKISLFHDIDNGSFNFEVNLYEPKLFQDTTVSSSFPYANNAFGAIGFIGRTKQFGEQWLYSRPDFGKISDLTSRQIEKVFLHIPILNSSFDSVDVFIPEKRFCSFGSTWNNKVNASARIISSNNNDRYISIDATTMFTNRVEHNLVYNEGLILKKPKGKNDFIAISTGDCYSAPQILEIKFKN
ncbi:MAG: hypothetical protein IKY41_07890 [Clostridia bacterium]|nr:hypothetical protein [Clostridia bacterium]